MPECVTCGGDEYELIDGMYYCSICQTQSQDLREEEVDEEEDNRGYSQSLEITQRKVKKEKAEKDKGRPWHTHEGWTVIIKHQVEALINLGANPKLKDVVLRLWMLYLSKCGLAFNKDKMDPLPLSTFRVRDQCVPSVSDPYVTESRTSKTMKKKAAMSSVKRLNEKKESQELKESLHGMEFYEGDNPFEDSNSLQSDSDREDEGEKKAIKEVVTSTGRNPRNIIIKEHLKSPEMLTPTRALVFSYIGVLYLHDAFSPYDLVRWINSNKVPMKRLVLSIFPSDMKLSGTDYETFVVNRMPTAPKIRQEAARICHFLEIVGSKPPDLELFCSRYIVELKLPGEFHYLVRVILQIIPYKLNIHKYIPKRKNCPTRDNIVFVEMDIFAMAVIVVLMKVIFVLDDASERKLTDFARKFKKKITIDKSPFIFEDWLHYMEYCVQNADHEHFPLNITDISRIRNIEPCLTQFEKEQAAAADYVESNISKCGKKIRSKTCHRDIQDMLKRTLTTLKESFEYHYSHEKESYAQSDSDQESDDNIPGFTERTSFISMLQKSAKESEYQEMKVEDTDDENPADFKDSKFQRSSVRYILQPDYLSDMQINSLSDENNISTGDDMQNVSRESANFDDKEIRFSQSEFITSTQTTSASQERQERQEASSADAVHTETLKELQEELDSLISEKKYWFRNLNSVKPRSYDRVLRILADKTGCNIDLLDKFVYHVEIIYLSSKEHGVAIHSMKNKLTKQYFDVSVKSVDASIDN